MNKTILRIFALVLAVCLCFGAVGCGKAEVVIEPMEKEEVITYGIDFIGGKDVMPVSGYYGPMPTTRSFNGNDVTDNIKQEVFDLLAEAGINHLSYTEWGNMDITSETTNNYFEYAANSGIAVTLKTALSNIANPTIADDTIKPYVEKFPNFASVFVTDEPSGLDYFVDSSRELANYFNHFKALDELGYFAYCNLYPIYDIKQKQQYDDYLERYLSNCSPQVLIFDHYPFETGGYQTYFYNMSAIRTKAEKYKIPWWCFIQAYTGESAKYKDLSEGQYHWLYNTFLAYGAKGVNVYLAMQNVGDVSTIVNDEDQNYTATRIGLLGAFGQKTRYWFYNKNICDHLKSIDHILMNSVNKGLLVTGKLSKEYLANSAHLLKGNSWREIKEIKGDTIVGCFNYNGKSAFYVVNASFEKAQKVTVNFHNEYKLSVFDNAQESNVETNKLELDLHAGEGVLIVVE